MRSAQCRMPRKRHFEGRRENTHTRIRLGRGQDEGGFRQDELQRQRLHRLGTERTAVFEHRQRIAAQALLGENVDNAKGEVSHGSAAAGAVSNADTTSRANVAKPPAETSRTSARRAGDTASAKRPSERV